MIKVRRIGHASFTKILQGYDDMTPPLQASDVMTPNPATVTEASAVEAAIRLMLDRHISGLPVLDAAGLLVGIVTEGDLLRRAELGTEVHRTGWLQFLRGPSRQTDDYVESHSRVVGDVMTQDVLTADASASLTEVVAIMREKRVKRVPILNQGHLVGIVSRSDLLRKLAEALSHSTSHVDGPFRDADVRRAVLAELQAKPWAPVAAITVRVLDGVVDLDGTLFVEADRAAIRVAAQNVSGVMAVRDHMIWVEPNSGMTYAPSP